MQSKQSFIEGYKCFTDNVGAYLGGELSRLNNEAYLGSIQTEIDNLTEALNAYKGNANPQLKGLAAEAWETYTFNIDAAAKQSVERATQVQSTGLGSVDVSTSWGDDYSLKFYKSGDKSAFAQGHSLEYAYQRYIHNLQDGVDIPTREEYLRQSGLDPNTDMSLCMYEGQARLIPSDQIKDAIDALNKRIIREMNNLDNPDRMAVAERLMQVKDKLTDHISGPNGEYSIPLTEHESRILADQAREGKFDPARYDITAAKKADALVICENAMKAGLNAAWISALLKTVPELIAVIKKMVRDGAVGIEDFENVGKAGVSGAKDGFVRGLLCAWITSSSQLGHLGSTMQSATQSANFAPCIGVAVVLLCQSVSDGVKCAKGEISTKQYAYNIERSLYVGVGGLAGGLALQAIVEIPVVSYAVGSMIGSLLGGLTFTIKESVMMSLCVKNGYTIFGLVEQDYTMPDEVRKKLGFPVYGKEEYYFKEYKRQTYEKQTYHKKTYDWQTIDCIILKRGVIGFRKVGYV
ncbi:MAG: hypothetical protein E7107_08430 [Prevotella sp.]|nr:hypothetical protein [Prevotella sp.]